MNRIIGVIILQFIVFISFAQHKSELDSLILRYKGSKNYSDSIHNQLEIGNWYIKTGQYKTALDYDLSILKKAEIQKDFSSISIVCNNIATIYRETGKDDLVLQYALKSVQLTKYVSDFNSIANSYNTLANYYYDNFIDSLAIKYGHISHEYRLKGGVKKDIALSFNNLGAMYFDIGKQKKGTEFVLKALQLRKEMNDKKGIANCYLRLGEMSFVKNEYQTSVDYFKTGLSMIDSTFSPYTIKQFYWGISDSYSKLDDYKSAFNYRVLMSKINDSIINIESNKQILELQTRYQTEKKEKDIKLKNLEIKQQKSRNYIQLLLFIGLGLTLIIVFVFISYRNRQRQKSTLLQESNRQEKLRFKVMIESEEKERIRIAKDLHDGLGQILSTAKLNLSGLEDSVEKEDQHLLNNSIRIIDEAVSEVRNISHNLMPTAIMNYDITTAISVLVEKINDSANIKVNFDKETFKLQMTKEMEISLYRIVQEVLNNMIKHSQTKQIDIVLSSENQEINLKIQDYGIGFDTAQIEQSNGIGWKNIYSRVSMLNGKIDLDSQIGKGTVIKIKFSFINL